MKVLKVILMVVAVLVLAFAAFLLYATLSDYSPEEKVIVFQSPSNSVLSSEKPMSLLIWNIGYCGLSNGMDFFYDGGKQVRPEAPTVQNNLKAVNQFLTQNDSIDFILLQEVDRDSKRSYHYDEFDSLSVKMPDYTGYYAPNYVVDFVPVPMSDPLGQVGAGLATYSKAQTGLATRYQFPGNYAWPKSLFMLDRCFLVTRYALDNGKELIVVNTHNSAYDDGTLKAGQMKFLRNFLTAESQKGNYIVVGGDWNQTPANYEAGFENDAKNNHPTNNVSVDYMPEGWTWAYDTSTPSNRELNKPYTEEQTFRKVIDFFLLSPNVELISVHGIDLDFKNSDHNPVKMSIKLK